MAGGPQQRARIQDAYKQMWETGLFRPQAPGDGMGHISLSDEQLYDPNRLNEEAIKYALNFVKEESTCSFFIGCSGWEANKALVYLVETARAVCARDFDLAATLLKMAEVEVEWASQQKIR